MQLTAKTSFHLETQRNEATYLSSIDFDGDDIKDPASYLKYDESANTYTPLNADQSSEATHMGIYFTTGVETDPTTNLAIPSIIRAVDRIPQYKNKGLLKTINSVDLAQTDLYVFRVSTGQLMTSHKGVEQGTFDDDYSQGGTFNNAFNFEFAMRGPDDFYAAVSPYPDYVGWASATKVTEPFQKENADHIRPGEQLQLVAINRASGYIGSTKFTSKQVGAGGDISNALDKIIMRPPNLKIWAERVHEIQQGRHVAGEEEQTNLIGNEGITLEDDLAVSVHTEWLDYDGLPLPAELGDFGYTARIAKVTSTPTPDVDALRQNSTNEFAIKPGRNLSVLQFTREELSRHHFYVQVNPYPKSQQNDFGSEIYNPLHKNYLPDGSGEDDHDLPDVDNTDLEGNQTTQANPLKYRPAHYVPFKVPLYDEQYSQIQQDVYDDLIEQGEADNTDKPDPLYRWYYRPELQFSQYNFDAKSLIVNQIDEDGTESTTDINIEDDGADFGPIFDDYTDSVELLFDLLGPELDRLPPLENDREFVLSLGGEEAIATIGADGKVTFENPDHLTRLNSEDLLSLRLYLNGDAGNILWEYQILGVSPFWSIYPNQQPQVIRKLGNSIEEAVAHQLNLPMDWFISKAYADDPFDDTQQVVDGESYYSLGGMRIKLVFNEPEDSGRRALFYRWSIGADNSESKLYDTEDPEYNENNELVGGLQTVTGVWGSPEVWLEANKWVSNRKTKIVLEVFYSPLEFEKVEFDVVSRLLKPTTPAPMQGPDVAMLESLLWQLGISPQYNNPGMGGSRINSDRGMWKNRALGWTKTCQNEKAEDRSIYYQGWNSTCAANNSVSLEGMVRRFQGRMHASSNSKSTHKGTINNGSVDGKVGNGTLNNLKVMYHEYRKAAYSNSASHSIDMSHPLINTWLKGVTDIFDSGLVSNTSVVPASYTEQKHLNMLLSAGVSDPTKTREALLLAWKRQESDGHWGRGSPVTPFRMTEGSGDELGSLSFSQVLFRYRYGKASCIAHRNSGLNFYDPADNMKSFAVHLNAAKTALGSCQGEFNKVYGEGQTGKTYANVTDLKGYIQGDSTLKSLSTLEDDYETLARAIGGYNGGGFYGAKSWPELIKTKKFTTVATRSNSGENCSSCTYSINVRNQRFGLPYRTYVWKGGDTLQDTNGNNVQDAGEAKVPWCFAYGEKEWLTPDTFTKAGISYLGQIIDYKKRALRKPANRIVCE